MAKPKGTISRFQGGISDSNKEGQSDSYRFARSIDYRSDARQISILPKTNKESGSYIEALPKWIDRVGTDAYIYDALGNIYKRTPASVYSKEHTATDSHGNGLKYFGEDRFLYYTQDETIGRYGPVGSDFPVFTDNFLGVEGGAPTNTHSIVFDSGSSQHAVGSDTASTSITGDLSIEAYIKPETLPDSGETMTLVSKWSENSKRSYKLDIGTVSNFFGDGSDGALTISTNTTDAPIDSTASGTVDTYSLTATNTSFSAGQKILIHQTRGTNAGEYQITTIESYTAGTITTADPLKVTYTTSGSNAAQVLVLKQYTNVTVNAGVTWTAKAWDGSVGGILAFLATGTVTVSGTITATGKGFRGATQTNQPTGTGGYAGSQGEGTGGAAGTQSILPNGNGGGGGGFNTNQYQSGNGGGGGGSATAGGNGYLHKQYGGTGDGSVGLGGSAVGTADLTNMTFGGGGGSGGQDDKGGNGYGGNGGGIIGLFGVDIEITGAVTSKGEAGGFNVGTSDDHVAGGGGGGGGHVLIKAQTATLGTNLIDVTRGFYGYGCATNHNSQGGFGGYGSIHIDYLTSYTGTTTPTLNTAVDDSLGNSDGYTLRFLVSDDGDASEIYSQEITEGIAVNEWARWQISWDASLSTTKFYRNGVLIGTKTGSMTSIDDNASLPAIAADFDGTDTAQNFFNGKMDDIRIWNDIRSASEFVSKNDTVLSGLEPNLIAYYKLDNDCTDSQTDGNNDLTAQNAPIYDAEDVAFVGITDKNNLDQSLDTAGNTYTLPTAISEAATARQTFTPEYDPQYSIAVNIVAIGTGDWTITVHDAQNREMATATVTNAELITGIYEFVFDSVWRPVIGQEYHFHLTSTVADGTVVTTDNADLETAEFFSYYQFLVDDDDFHPITQHLNFLAIGNERYIAKWNGVTYEPNKIVLPADYRVRCFGYWREYLAIGTWRGNTITDTDEGRIFFWDGISDTYNFFIDVPEGSINSMLGSRGILYINAGYSGEILAYQGGTAAQTIKNLPKLERDETVEIYPDAMNMWKGILRLGVAGDSNSDNLEKGVYSYGNTVRLYEDSLSYDFPLSTMNFTGDDVKVGTVKAIGEDLLIGYQDGTSYGVDSVAVTNNPFLEATYESLIIDYDELSRYKFPLTVRVDFEPLVLGESIEVKYKLDRADDFTIGYTEDTVDATVARAVIRQQVKELEIGVNLKTTGSTTPVVTGITLESDLAQGTRSA